MRDSSRTGSHRGLIVGLLALEFGAAANTYVLAVIVPPVVADLHAQGRYPLIVAPNAIGLFLALPLARWLLQRLGARRALAGALLVTVLGAAAAALAQTPWTFAAGRLAVGFAGGVLAVFSLGAALAQLDDRLRTRVLALLAAMWVIPALVVPPLALLAEQAIGWRWTSVLLVPLILVARALLGRPSPRTGPSGARTPIARALLVPIGMAVVLSAGGSAWGWIGLLVTVGGAGALLPAGTLRARPGPPRAMAVLAVVSAAYFGADSLFTLAVGHSLGGSTLATGAVLAAAGVSWGVFSQVQPGLVGRRHEHDEAVLLAGLVLLLGGLVELSVVLAAQADPWWAVLGAGLTGAGMGLVYPTLYFAATTLTAGGPDATSIAGAVVLTEALGTSIGIAMSSGIVSSAVRSGLLERSGLAIMFTACAGLILFIAPLALRSGRVAER